MRGIRTLCAALGMVLAVGSVTLAQPTLSSSSTTASPGTAVILTVTGQAGQNFAIIGSTVGGGFSYGGTALAVGPDVIIIAQGTLTGASAAVAFTPPFQGTSIDRYYVQAATSAAPSFVPLQASAGLILRNTDAAPATEMGSAATGSVTLVAGTNYVITTPAFVADRDVRCLVTSSVQAIPGGPVTANLNIASVRNAVSRNGVLSSDGTVGQYIVSNGSNTWHPPLTRSSVIPVAAGETIRFGAWLADIVYAGSRATVGTSYLCQ